MDKFVKILAKDEPYITPDCPNCNNALKIKTEDFFGASDNYETICPHCKWKVTFSGIKKQLDQLKRQFESLGITWQLLVTRDCSPLE